MITLRQYLRQLNTVQLRRLFDMAKLSDMERWLLIYAFVEKRYRENTCDKLGIGKTKYHTMLNEALLKVEHIIEDLDKVRTLQ